MQKLPSPLVGIKNNTLRNGISQRGEKRIRKNTFHLVGIKKQYPAKGD